MHNPYWIGLYKREPSEIQKIYWAYLSIVMKTAWYDFRLSDRPRKSYYDRKGIMPRDRVPYSPRNFGLFLKAAHSKCKRKYNFHQTILLIR
jgi:hypothetical protein